jgi:serine phosphatase RsbU (regulator of sigma subunit)
MHQTRLLKILGEMPLDDLMTIGELKIVLNKQIDDQKQQRIDEDNKIVSQFKGRYLKVNKDSKLFGDELEVIQIVDITPESYTTDWERTFQLSGSVICFSAMINIREFRNGDVYSMFTETQLNEYTFITEDEFTSYMNKALKLKYDLEQIINGD